MKNLVVALGAVCMMVRCDSPDIPQKRAPQSEAMNEEKETSSSRSGFSGLEMRMFESSPTLGETRTISFRIRAGSGEILNDANIYSLQDVSAVAYSENGEEIHFEAKRADYNGVEEEAHLQGDVRIQVGVFKLTMQRVDWDNEERVARSDTPVTIDHGGTRLTASGGMTIDLRTQGVVFRGVEGRFDFDKEKS